MSSPRDPAFAFLDTQILPWKDAHVPLTTHSLLYGTGCYEGLRGYWNKEKGKMNIFRGKDHYRRLHNSCRILTINLPYSVDDLVRITSDLIVANNFEEAVYIRPVAYKKLHPNIIGSGIAEVSDGFFMFALAMPVTRRPDGVHLGTSSWRRIKDTMIPPRGKICGNYVNTGLARSDAVRSGYDDCLFLTEEGYVSEGGTSNIVMVREGTLITPPPYMDILEGITLDCVLTIARDMGYPVSVRPFHRSELFVADEAFICGTFSGITAVTRVDHRNIDDGKPGPITRSIGDRFSRIIEGYEDKYNGWFDPVGSS